MGRWVIWMAANLLDLAVIFLIGLWAILEWVIGHILSEIDRLKPSRNRP